MTDITLTIPEVYAEGLYKNEGRFNNIRIKSKGYFNVTARKCSCLLRILFHQFLNHFLWFLQVTSRCELNKLVDSKRSTATDICVSPTSICIQPSAIWNSSQLAFYPIRNWVSSSWIAWIHLSRLDVRTTMRVTLIDGNANSWSTISNFMTLNYLIIFLFLIFEQRITIKLNNVYNHNFAIHSQIVWCWTSSTNIGHTCIVKHCLSHETFGNQLPLPKQINSYSPFPSRRSCTSAMKFERWRRFISI